MEFNKYGAYMRYTFCVALLFSASMAVEAGDSFNFNGSAELEYFMFPFEAAHNEQGSGAANVHIQPKFQKVISYGGVTGTYTATPNIRYFQSDVDQIKVDFIEAKIEHVIGDATFTIGNDYIYWGKMEVDQLVDIINQSDLASGTDTDDKLGQPMIAATYYNEIGSGTLNTEYYFMPYFVERTYPNSKNRLRIGVPVNDSESEYSEYLENGKNTFSYAARATVIVDDAEVAFSIFDGVSREPNLKFQPETNELIPVYNKITQYGIDAQYTGDSSLWKMELVYREGQQNRENIEEDYWATIFGIEHTVYRIDNTNADIGLIMEYAYDNRDEKATTIFQDDIVVGARIAHNDSNDTAVLITASYDTNYGDLLLRIDGGTRISDDFTVNMDVNLFTFISEESPVYELKRDNNVRVKLKYSW